MHAERLAYRVAIYARVSTAGQAETNLSVPDQIERIRAYCTERNYHVIREYKDEGKSGASVAGRDQFKQMIDAGLSKDPPFNLILTRDAERFGRGDEDNLLRNRLRENGVRIDNITSPVGDMSGEMTPEQRLHERFGSAMGIYQREQVPAKVIASQKRAVNERGFTGSIGTMFGYKSVYVGMPPNLRRTIEVDPENGPIVREMFQRCAEGQSPRTIRNWLNAMQVATPRNGNTWNDSTVRRILTNETATGTAVYGRLQHKKDHVTGKARNVKGRSEPIKVIDAFPGLVSRRLFDKVQRRLATRTATLPNEGNPINLVQGLIFCQHCGWALAFQRRRLYWYYMCGKKKTYGTQAAPECSGTLRKEYVDRAMVEYIQRRVEVRDYRSALQDSIQTHNDAAESYKGIDEIVNIDALLKRLTKRQENLLDAIEAGATESMLERLREVEGKIDRARTQRDVIGAALRSIEPIDAKKTIEAATALRQAIKRGELARVRELLPTLIHRVEVDLTQRPENSEFQHTLGYAANRKYQGFKALTIIARYDLRKLKQHAESVLRTAFEFAG